MKTTPFQHKKTTTLLIALCYLLIVPCSLLFALDISIAPSGFMFFPSGEGNLNQDGSERYDTGGGMNAAIDFDIASVLSNPLGIGYTLGVEGSLAFSPSFYGDSQFSFYSVAGSLGLYYFIFSRLPLRVDGAVGVYTANDGEAAAPSDLYYRFGGETGFRFTPGFTLTAGGGWRQYQGEKNPLNSGVYASVGARLTFEVGEQTSGGASASLVQDDSVYPVIASLYQLFPIGELTLRNNENAEIRNVKVAFRAGNYTSSEFPCGEAFIIPKGRRVKFPLYADFSSEILRFADNGRILGEVVIRYTFLGKQREAVQTVNIAVNNRNSPVPGDNMALASFASISSEELLQFARYASALARSNHKLGLNSNMERGIFTFEAVRGAVKIRSVSSEQGAMSNGIGEVQYPSQTLAYGSGSVLDAGLLYAACLQATGTSAALVLFPDGEVVAAVGLGIEPSGASMTALFNGTDKILIAGDDVWIPAAMSRLGDGFSVAWQEGINRINNMLNNNESAEMIIIDEAWITYPPASFPSSGIRLVMPDSNTINTAGNAVVQNYIRSEFGPKISAVQDQIRRSPNATLYNQLGNLLLRSQQTAQAKTAYETAAGMGLTGAMVNRGNIALNENDIAGAERWFKQALAREPQNKSALKGMEFVEARK